MRYELNLKFALVQAAASRLVSDSPVPPVFLTLDTAEGIQRCACLGDILVVSRFSSVSSVPKFR